jgi:hypothetical protein
MWLLWLLALAGLIVAGVWLWRRRPASGGGRPARRRPPRPAETTPTPAATESYEAMDQAGYAGAPVQETAVARAALEVIEAQTDMSPVYALDEAEVRIGRSPNQSQLAFVNDITVSRFHAVLRLEGSRYRIYDAGSTSGTYVNDRPVPEYGLQLSDGDDIQLGAVRLRYRQL